MRIIIPSLVGIFTFAVIMTAILFIPHHGKWAETIQVVWAFALVIAPGMSTLWVAQLFR